jgi:hypothetical protein
MTTRGIRRVVGKTNHRSDGLLVSMEALSRNIGILYGAIVLDQPRELHPRNGFLGPRGTSPAVEAGDLPGANFQETPLSESE